MPTAKHGGVPAPCQAAGTAVTPSAAQGDHYGAIITPSPSWTKVPQASLHPNYLRGCKMAPCGDRAGDTAAPPPPVGKKSPETAAADETRIY